MRALLSPEPPSISYLTPTRTTKRRSIFHWKIQTSLRFSAGNGNCSIRPRSMCLNVKSALDSATIDQLGLPESEIRNPSVSPSYRSWKLPKPNQTVLDAQARVCTGPTQTKPLGEEQALKVLDTILRSGVSLFFVWLLGKTDERTDRKTKYYVAFHLFYFIFLFLHLACMASNMDIRSSNFLLKFSLINNFMLVKRILESFDSEMEPNCPNFFMITLKYREHYREKQLIELKCVLDMHCCSPSQSNPWIFL